MALAAAIHSEPVATRASWRRCRERLVTEGRLTAAARDMLEKALPPTTIGLAPRRAAEEEVDADELARDVTVRLGEINQDLSLLADVFTSLDDERRDELLKQLRYSADAGRVSGGRSRWRRRAPRLRDRARLLALLDRAVVRAAEGDARRRARSRTSTSTASGRRSPPRGTTWSAGCSSRRSARGAPDARAVGGLTLGADPLASAVSLISHLDEAPAARVHRAQGAQGPRHRAVDRGPLGVPGGGPVAILEDVVTTGGSTLKAIERARGRGARGRRRLRAGRSPGGRPRGGGGARGIALTALFTRQDFIREPCAASGNRPRSRGVGARRAAPARAPVVGEPGPDCARPGRRGGVPRGAARQQ